MSVVDLLVTAAAAGDTAQIRRLLDNGADINGKSQSNHGCTALMSACNNGREETVRQLITCGAIVNFSNNGWTALHCASSNGHAAIVEILLTNGADHALAHSNGNTALHCAAIYCFEGVAEVLLRHGANHRMQNAEGNTALHLASTKGCVNVLDVLLRHGSELGILNQETDTPLHVAAKVGQARSMELLLRQCGDSSCKDKYGSTPLHWAAYRGHREVVELLLARGANHAALNNMKWTALHYACEKGFKAVADLLLRNGADCQIQDEEGQTPLHRACKNGHVEIAEILLALGADHTIQCIYGSTPLHWACYVGQMNVAELLLRCGVMIQGKNKNGNTPLHLSCIKGYHDIAALLLCNGADKTIRNEDGKTAIAYVQSSSSLAALEAIEPKTAEDLKHERDAARLRLWEIMQKSCIVAQNECNASRAELTVVMSERDAFRLELESVRVELMTAHNEKDVSREAAVSAQLERDALRELVREREETIVQLRNEIANVSVICPFQRYRPHALTTDILPPSVVPGIHSVSDSSPLFAFCKSLTKSGGRQFFPVAGHRLVHVQAICPNEDMSTGYTACQSKMKRQRLEGGKFFNFDTSTFNSDQMKVLEVLRDQFHERIPGERAANFINTVYCYHGPRLEDLTSVCSTGLVAMRRTDAGFFGSPGCYTTLNMEYALRYARGEFDGGPRPSQNGRYPVVMFAATVGMAYPVTPGMDYGNVAGIPSGHSDFFGRPLKAGFDCHVVCVNQDAGFQAVNKEKSEYVELVFDQQSQLLPIAVLWFEEN